MIWIIVLGTFLTGALIMAAGRIKLVVAWKNLDGTMSLQYLFFRKSFPLKKSKDESPKELPDELQKEEKIGEGKNGGFSFASIKAIPDFLPPVRKLFELFIKYGRVTELSFNGKLGTGDPYHTGLSYGLAQSLGQFVKSFYPLFEFNLSPNFEEEVYDFTARGKGEIRFFNLLVVILVTLIYLPKKKVWQLVRNS